MLDVDMDMDMDMKVCSRSIFEQTHANAKKEAAPHPQQSSSSFFLRPPARSE